MPSAILVDLHSLIYCYHERALLAIFLWLASVYQFIICTAHI